MLDRKTDPLRDAVQINTRLRVVPGAGKVEKRRVRPKKCDVLYDKESDVNPLQCKGNYCAELIFVFFHVSYFILFNTVFLCLCFYAFVFYVVLYW